MLRSVYLLCCALTLCSLSANATTESQSITQDCHLKGIKEKVQCGTLQVPENYQKPGGEQISLNFAVLPAIDNSEHKLPFMFLAGGPGQAAVSLASAIRTMFPEVRKTHDIILVDQRGTGKSHPFECEEDNSKSVYVITPEDFSEQEIKDCLAEFKGDLSQYNSENAVRDFDQVRQALGAKQIHLYGGSYGTRAALVYMKLFPDSLKTVTLDSVGPIEVPIGLFGQSSAQSFQKLLTHCNDDKSCARAFPNLRAEFDTIMQRLNQGPITTTIQHPTLGTDTKFVISRSKFISVLRMQLYNVQTRYMVPEAIHQTALGNYRPLAGLVATTDNAMGINTGLLFNIVCNEDIPRTTLAQQQQDANNDFGGAESHQAWLKACPLWPQYRPSEAFYQPVTANIPTLILSGGLDPVTPPSNGEYPAKSLPNAHHIVVENSGHIVVSHSCAADIVSEFIESANPNKLDESCLENVEPEHFMTSLNGSL